MSWIDIHINDYGWIGKLTLQQDGVALDISSYTTLNYIFKDPSGVAAAAKVAAFDSDGTDGILKYTIVAADIDEVGKWYVQARISKVGAVLTSDWHQFDVADRLD
jgi:hypothetical protein